MEGAVVISTARSKGKGKEYHRVHETLVTSAVDTMFRETAFIVSHHAKARRAHSPSHGPRELVRAPAKTVRDNETENPTVPRVPKNRTNVRLRWEECKTVRFEEPSQETRENPKMYHTDQFFQVQ